MGKLGKGKSLLAANVDSKVHAYVTLRAKHNEWSGTKMTGMILKWWLAQGAPTVVEGELGALKYPWDPNFKWEKLLETEAVSAKGEHAAASGVTNDLHLFSEYRFFHSPGPSRPDNPNNHNGATASQAPVAPTI